MEVTGPRLLVNQGWDHSSGRPVTKKNAKIDLTLLLKITQSPDFQKADSRDTPQTY